ncbi:hypothetical protein MILUP08_45694 [Micromonospora lupini str. Lupac 08]|uniref:Uncharacterized protein n=1 Tax=Micromonospora lupini str. Lupac 08 TaxID=1150864 RepID=I0LAF4_9ACTN|nr:hypothetical protein MILUP08_45694 [Micromonospora lupini str. Lupac 08]
MWRSLVAHSLWERGAVGSNPATPTVVSVRVAPGASSRPRRLAYTRWANRRPRIKTQIRQGVRL